MRPGRDRNLGLRKGAWTAEEDMLLKNHIQKFGEGKWHLVPLKAGLNRCRKSCRLRWVNYLKPDIKRGDFEEDEVDLMLRLHKLLGNRWSLIAGRIPGRTANDVKNYWNTYIRSRTKPEKEEVTEGEQSYHILVPVIKPQARTVSKSLNMCPHIEPYDTCNMISSTNDGFGNACNTSSSLVLTPTAGDDKINEYWNELLEDPDKDMRGGAGWPFRDVVEQEDGQNSLFNFPLDDDTWDLLDSEQL